MWGVSSRHKDLALLVNPGSHVYFHAAGLPRGVFTHCMKIFGAPTHWPGIVGGGGCHCCWNDDALGASQEGDG